MLSVPGTQTRLLVLTPDDPHVLEQVDQSAQQLHRAVPILPATVLRNKKPLKKLG